MPVAFSGRRDAALYGRPEAWPEARRYRPPPYVGGYALSFV